MSARMVNLNAIPLQYADLLPFQIPPTNPVVQPYLTFVSDVITIPANTDFLVERFTIAGADVPANAIVVSCKLVDGVDYSLALPFGISTWVDDAPDTDVLVTFWNSSGIDKDVRAVIVTFVN